MTRLQRSATPEPAILHLFDWPFKQVEAALPALARAGFDAVQVSPPQASADAPDWWARYQPIDHTRIDGPLGTEAEFRSMLSAAHRCEPPLKVVVDVVLNHMAEHAPSGTALHYPRFGPDHFHPRRAVDWDSIGSIRTGWIGHGPDLPDLRTEDPYVRAEARRYLELLLDCGADGFRFDAVKHIEPEYFDAVLAGLPSSLLKYGEYIPQPGHGRVMAEYLRTMRLMDFTGLSRLGRVLCNGGPARDLVDDAEGEGLIPVERAVAFVTNHDIELEQYAGFTLPQDLTALANAHLIGRAEAPVLVWTEHRSDPVVRATLALRRLHARTGRTLRWLERQLVVWSYGDEGLLVLNLSDEPAVLDRAQLGVQGGWIDDVTGQVLEAVWTMAARRPLIARRSASPFTGPDLRRAA